MTEDNSIFIKNIYYMLAYAFQILRQKNFEYIASEKFESIQDLFAAILAKGISGQLKQGLYREYITKQESMPVLRGKLDIHSTIRNQMQQKKMLGCEYDELSEDNIYNRILKTTAIMLMNDISVKKERKAELKKVILYFADVNMIKPMAICWNMLKIQRNNRNYEMLINICYFVLDGMIQTTESGNYKMKDFSDEHMHKLYEKFVLEYFRKHHSYLTEIRSAQIKWNLSENTEERMIHFLPVMQTDIYLKMNDQVLIIDTKYYSKVMQKQYNKATLHSSNLYQIFTYVKNADRFNTGKASGMLLYAKTDEEITPDCSFIMDKNKISVKTLDLNKDFDRIAQQLDKIIEEHFL